MIIERQGESGIITAQIQRITVYCFKRFLITVKVFVI